MKNLIKKLTLPEGIIYGKDLFNYAASTKKKLT